jgi:hypothetical protein
MGDLKGLFRERNYLVGPFSNWYIITIFATLKIKKKK